MRESIGATGIFTIVITFIVLFTAYLAVSVNYAKAFRIKNHIVDMVEENGGWTNSNEEKEKIRKYLTYQNYGATGHCPQYMSSSRNYNSDTNNQSNRAFTRVGMISSDSSNGDEYKCLAAIYAPADTAGNAVSNCNSATAPTNYPTSYYLVMDFFKIDLPVVNVYMTYNVYGETKTIVNYDSTCP